MPTKLKGQVHQLGDRVLKKLHYQSKGFDHRIYGHITNVKIEENSIGRKHYYYSIKHENTEKTSVHAGHMLIPSPLPPR